MQRAFLVPISIVLLAFAPGCSGTGSAVGSDDDAGAAGMTDGATRSPDGALVFVDPTCGGPGQRCCVGDSCTGGGCCVEQACVADGTACGSLGQCSKGSCGGCGGVGQPCCAMIHTESCSGVTANCGGCTAPGTMCPSNKPGDTCITCGAEGQNCCVNDCVDKFAYCESFNGVSSFDTNKCSSACGNPGQPCCQNNSCRDGGCCMEGSSGGAVCAAASTCGCNTGKCTTCGLSGLACCAGNTCAVGEGPCVNGMCQQPQHP